MPVYNTEAEYQANLNQRHGIDEEVEQEEPLTDILGMVLGFQNISGFMVEVKANGKVIWRNKEFESKEAFDDYINLKSRS